MDQVAGQMVLVKLVKVEVPKVVVGDVLGKHVIDGYQDLMGNCHRGTLVATARLKAVELVTQICALGPGCRVSGLDEGCLQVQIAFGNAAAFALATRLVVAWAHPRPGGQL